MVIGRVTPGVGSKSIGCYGGRSSLNGRCSTSGVPIQMQSVSVTRHGKIEICAASSVGFYVDVNVLFRELRRGGRCNGERYVWSRESNIVSAVDLGGDLTFYGSSIRVGSGIGGNKENSRES